MNINKNGNVLNTVLIVIAVIIVISYGLMKSSLFVSETVRNNKLSSNSIIDVNNNRIDNNHVKGNLYINNDNQNSKISMVNLEESKSLEVSIPGNNVSSSKLKIEFATGVTNRYLGLELTKSKNNKNLINKNIDARGGFIIKDSSTWSQSLQESNIIQQEYLLRNNKISELSNFLTSEINKIGEPGSYILFDFGNSTLINTFSFQLTHENKSSYPNIIQLTFDNGIQHNFLIDDKKGIQKLYFPDVETKFVRLDILTSSDGRVDTNNTAVVNNIERNLLSSEIIFTNDTVNKVLDFNFPSLQNINGVKFVNIYSGYNGVVSSNSFKSILKNESNFKYYYNNETIDTIFFELCSDINVCLEKVAKSLK